MKDINRFLEAQETTYQQALQEVKVEERQVIGFGISFLK